MTDTAIALLKFFEGFSPSPYSDIAGHGTVGYGHKIRLGEEDRFAGRVLTEAEGEKLLVVDFLAALHEVVNLTDSVHLEEYEKEALGSFVYNLGGRKFAGSTLLRAVKVEKRSVAAKEFLRWRFAAGKPQAGLVRRRHVESVWFLGAAHETLTYVAGI